MIPNTNMTYGTFAHVLFQFFTLALSQPHSSCTNLHNHDGMIHFYKQPDSRGGRGSPLKLQLWKHQIFNFMKERGLLLSLLSVWKRPTLTSFGVTISPNLPFNILINIMIGMRATGVNTIQILWYLRGFPDLHGFSLCRIFTDRLNLHNFNYPLLKGAELCQTTITFSF